MDGMGCVLIEGAVVGVTVGVVEGKSKAVAVGCGVWIVVVSGGGRRLVFRQP